MSAAAMPAPASVGDDVEVGEPRRARASPLREREADGLAVVLGEQGDVVADDRLDLAQLLLVVDVDVRRRLDLALERAPEVPERREVGLGGAADIGHGTRSPTSR